MLDFYIVGKVEDLDNREDIILANSPQDVEKIRIELKARVILSGHKMRYLDEILNNFECFFITIENGDYGEIYALEYSTPWIWCPIWALEDRKLTI